MIRKLLIPVGLLLLSFGYGQKQALAAIDIQPTKIVPVNVGGTFMIDVTLLISNPSMVPIPVDSLHLTIKQGTTVLGTARLTQPFTIPAQNSTLAQLRIDPDTAGLTAALFQQQFNQLSLSGTVRKGMLHYSFNELINITNG